LNNPGKKVVIVVCGPTAVGKSAVAIALAKHYVTEIISADSRQCFKELRIGVARPSQSELQEVKHHFIADHSVREEITAAGFEKYALQKAKDVFAAHDVVIMAGGTGLYIRAFCEGLDEIPAIGSSIRERIVSGYAEHGLGWLQEEVKKNDPEFYQSGEIKNPQRLMRALEVILATGKSILAFRKGRKAERDFSVIKIGLELSKEELHLHINDRVDRMFAEGLPGEVEKLEPYKQLNALQTVGYKEVFDYLNGNISLSQSVEEVKKNTRRYAKRQMTWFRKDKEVNWFSPTNLEGIIAYTDEMTGKFLSMHSEK